MVPQGGAENLPCRNEKSLYNKGSTAQSKGRTGMNLSELLQKYKSQILYLFFGGCTTLINVAVYGLCAHAANLSTTLSIVIAWVASVLFAYLTNRTWVFESRVRTAGDVLREMGSFFLGRSATGALDWAIMYVCVDRFGLPDMPVKLMSNVVVIILNYVVSKLFVFAKKES